MFKQNSTYRYPMIKSNEKTERKLAISKLANIKQIVLYFKQSCFCECDAQYKCYIA